MPPCRREPASAPAGDLVAQPSSAGDAHATRAADDAALERSVTNDAKQRSLRAAAYRDAILAAARAAAQAKLDDEPCADAPPSSARRGTES